MTRRLTGDERALWERLRETVKPLKRGLAKLATETAPRPAPRTARTKAPPKGAAAAPAPSKPTKAAPPALAPFEQKTLRRIGRGLVAIDARIDLHGMRQERAHTSLASFLRHSQASGARIVLVVTGKGRADAEGRGVLRESVPRWLAEPEFRPLVVGYEEAHRQHGGAGALYVRIRRRRAGALRRD